MDSLRKRKIPEDIQDADSSVKLESSEPEERFHETTEVLADADLNSSKRSISLAREEEAYLSTRNGEKTAMKDETKDFGGEASNEAQKNAANLNEGMDPSRPVRVYSDGIYDLFHLGHARSLEQAKKLFPHTYLLVGCCSDAMTHSYKGKTVMTEAERYESLRHCKWVDEVVENAPWVVTPEFIEKHNIDYVAHDALPYADASGAGKDVYEQVKKMGKFKETQRTDGISTSDIIMRILKDFNQYVMRNLARGYSRKELGVSYVMEKQLYVNMGIQKLQKQMEENLKQNREYIDRNVKFFGQNLGKALHTDWMKNTDKWMRGFMKSFDASFHFVEKAIQTQIKKNIIQKSKRQKMSKSRQNYIPHSLQIAPPLPTNSQLPDQGSNQRQPVLASSALQEIISAT